MIIKRGNYKCNLMLKLAMIVVVMMVERSEGVWLNLPVDGTKCLSEEIQSNVVVLGDYIVDDSEGYNPAVSVRVTILFFFTPLHFLHFYFFTR